MTIAIQDTYPEDFSHCYGCGRNNDEGYRIKTYRDDAAAVTDHQLEPFHTGGGTSAYGGVLASVIDCHAAGSAAIFWMEANELVVGSQPSPAFVTARLEVDYLAPTAVGAIHLTSTAEEVGPRKVIVLTELSSQGEVTVRGRAVFVQVKTS